MTSPSPALVQLLLALEQAYRQKAWHGTTLKGAVRGLSLEELTFRPAPERHNIWELWVHAAYWKATARRRIDPEAPRFPLAGSNFWERPAGASGRTEKAWKEDRALADRVHEGFLECVAGLAEEDLERFAGDSRETTVGDLVRGVAAHDLYHAGQIQLIKRLVRGS